MYLNRLIPILLIKERGLYKTERFKKPRYLGDPINSIKLFNDKEVDELIILDIGASKFCMEPDFEFIEKIASECFMPVCYGGGISSIDHVKKIFNLGIEKVAFNTSLFNNIGLIEEASKRFGAQSIVASLDVKKNIFGKYYIYSKSGEVNTKKDPIEFSKYLEGKGVGEILITSVDNEGLMNGYDLEIVKRVSSAVSVPVTANGGAGKLEDCKEIIDAGASAAAAGSIFVYFGKKKAILVNYPSEEERKKVLKI